MPSIQPQHSRVNRDSVRCRDRNPSASFWISLRHHSYLPRRVHAATARGTFDVANLDSSTGLRANVEGWWHHQRPLRNRDKQQRGKLRANRHVSKARTRNCHRGGSQCLGDPTLWRILISSATTSPYLRTRKHHTDRERCRTRNFRER